MKKTNLITKLFSLLVVSILLVAVGCDSDNSSIENTQAFQEKASVAKYTSTPIEGQYIVVLNDRYQGKSSSLSNLKYSDKMTMLKTEIPNNFSKAGLTKENIKNTFGYA